MATKTEIYPDLTQNSVQVLNRRYLIKDPETDLPAEKPENMFWRVSENLSQADYNYGAVEEQVKETINTFYGVMRRLEFIPNSPTLMNAGRELQQLSACFVIPIEDNLDAIFTHVKETALIHKSGGGTGFSFSRLRPEGDKVKSTGGVASGPCSFIRAFDTATDVVKQGGTRRGANMGVLSVYHPDVMKFICSKRDGVSLSNFNISIAVDQEFIEKARNREEYDVFNPRTKEKHSTLNAGEVFDSIIENAWHTGDPGLLFIDRINADNPNPQLGEIESTNPCGEQSLLPYESCNLGSINLSRMTKKDEDGSIVLDLDKLRETATVAVHMLDNVIDMNNYPLKEIEDVTKKTRRIGVGVMGFADMLIQMGIQYDSNEAIDTATRTMACIRETVYRASQELAEKRGPFPEWENSAYKHRTPMRNSAPTTIAPTGTISIIAGASSGVEPLFALAYVRNVMDNTTLTEVNEAFKQVAKDEGFYSDELMGRIAKAGGHISDEDETIPDHVKRVFRTSHQISPYWHVKMQAAFQQETDNAVSKTINLPNESTIEDIKTAYESAFDLGCKGITVYRDGSKTNQVLSTEATNQNGHQPEQSMPTAREWRRPRRVHGTTERVNTAHGAAYVTINTDDEGKIVEVFAAVGKPGGCDDTVMHVLTRTISVAAQHGVPEKTIIRQLRGSSCCPIWDDGEQVMSPADAIGIAMERISVGLAGGQSTRKGSPETLDIVTRSFNQQTKTNEDQIINIPPGIRRCQECNSYSAVLQEGCITCYNCGWEKC